MKFWITSFILLIATTAMWSQQEPNSKKGLAVKGYDVVSYFDGKPEKGVSDYKTTYNSIEYRFSTSANLVKFELNPEKYNPQYGGWCAFAMAKDKAADINPKSFEIKDGRLYLFYDSWGNNTLIPWQKDRAELQTKADTYWKNRQ